ncbi:MAG: DUF4838 domain-containing protein [Clostridia bacterium]|nr:DUF4838 domain-containing protein [Clostridia bacterium]
MYYINKISLAEPIDFAALELKKYLRMMMPEGGDVKIAYVPEAKEGFRLGLMQDFGLDTSDVESTELDDIIFIDCDERGGIIAGDNPRSVLLAVYEYLRRNGCRWLYPGIDGEFIPNKNIEPVKLRHVPPMRYRGFAAEGAPYREAEQDFLDFLPKVGMNTYMIEFRLPRSYYEQYYTHARNNFHRAPEPISDTLVLQWKRHNEAEIAKRGLQFHDIGHGWTVDPFGIDSKYAWDEIDESLVPKDMVQYLAEINGKRGLFEGRPINTQFCMSNPKARKLFADFVAKYAEEHPNIDFLHVWLADNVNNHCECSECRKKRPSDYYMLLMNDVDAALTARNLSTRIVFIAYLDTVFPPTVDTVANPNRFSLLLAPISRGYIYTRPQAGVEYAVPPYERNHIKGTASLGNVVECYKEWKKNFAGDGITFEYHFWINSYYDMSGLQIARRIYEDIEYYGEIGLKGLIENGTIRGFFPNGMAFYTYAMRMYREDLSFEKIAEDYYSHIYGSDYREFVHYLEKLGEIFPYRLMSPKKAEGGMRKTWDIFPQDVARLDAVEGVLAIGKQLVESHYNSENRVETVSVRLLERHLDYIKQFTDAIREKWHGNDECALELFKEFEKNYGAHEVFMQPYYDHLMTFSALSHLFTVKSNPYTT